MKSLRIKALSVRQIIGLLLLLTILGLNLSTPFIRDLDRSMIGPLDREALVYIDESLKKSLLAFGVAKTMNAAISFFQETTLAVQPLGLGVELPIGQVLDPLNDMVERSSWIFLLSATALGVQRLFVEIGQWVSVTVLLSLCLAVAALSIFLKRFLIDLRHTAIRLLLIFLLVRGFVPLSFHVSAHVYDQFMASTYTEQIGVLETQTEQMDDLSNKTRSRRVEKDKILAMFKELGHLAKDISDRLVKLITVFVAQVIVIPLGFLWLLVQGIRSILTWSMPGRFGTTVGETGGGS